MPRSLPLDPHRLAQLRHLTPQQMAQELGCPVWQVYHALRRQGLPATPARPVARPKQPRPVEPQADSWWQQWQQWMATYEAFFKASGFGLRAGLTTAQMSDLVRGRATTAATVARKQLLHRNITRVLQAALQELPPLEQ